MSLSWLERLKKVEAADATACLTNPALILERARGSYMWDVEGRAYTDLCAGFGALPLGHRSEAWVSAVEKTIADPRPPIIHGLGDVYASRAKVELIETLLESLPDVYSGVVLSVSGSQAVETALKTAMLSTERSGFIAFQGGYHGVDLGTLPLLDRPDFRRPFEDFWRKGGVEILPWRVDLDHLRDAASALSSRGFGFAGAIIEPVQGRYGFRAAERTWLQTLREFCDESDALLIFDEIFCGLGRSGCWSHSFIVIPDIICFGKALGGGLPLSACVGTRKAMAAWPLNTGEAIHTGTFFGHPLACQLGRETLTLIKSEGLVDRAKSLGERSKCLLNDALTDCHIVKEVRCHGLMAAIEFHTPGMGVDIMHRLRREGVIALAAGPKSECVTFTPALNIDETLWFDGLKKLPSVLNRV